MNCVFMFWPQMQNKTKPHPKVNEPMHLLCSRTICLWYLHQIGRTYCSNMMESISKFAWIGTYGTLIKQMKHMLNICIQFGWLTVSWLAVGQLVLREEATFSSTQIIHRQLSTKRTFLVFTLDKHLIRLFWSARPLRKTRQCRPLWVQALHGRASPLGK